MDQERDCKAGRVKFWWLASYPKSGNTWLRMLLSAYRNGGTVDINRPHELLVDDLQSYFTHIVSPEPIEQMSDGDKLLLRPAALLHLAKVQNSSKPCFVKTHFCNAKINGIDTIPEALTYGAIYMVRDPRDVVVSFAEHNSKQYDELLDAMERDDYMLRRPPLFHLIGSWNTHVQGWMSDKSPIATLVVRYEDMVADTAQCFTKILQFLKHEIDEDLVARTVEACSFKNLRAQEDAQGFREKAGGDKFFARGGVGNWQSQLSVAQVKRIKDRNGEMMRELGYA